MNITGGKYKGRIVKSPDERVVRPTLSKVRMSVFNTLYSMIGNFEGKSFLDVFGGSGIMGLEALSRGFEKVLVFEKNKMVSEIIKSNYEALDLVPNLKIGDGVKLIKKMNEHFDVVYVDPPYAAGLYAEILDWIITDDKLSESIIILEHSLALDINGFDILKQKKYGDKYLTFLKKRE